MRWLLTCRLTFPITKLYTAAEQALHRAGLTSDVPSEVGDVRPPEEVLNLAGEIRQRIG